MHLIRKITPDLYYTGVNDRRIALFENVYPVSDGVSYNSYVLLDEKTVVFDTADGNFTNKYLANVAAALNGRKADYLVVSHMEPDHSASVKALMNAYPDMKVICNSKSITMLANFFGDISDRAVLVKDGETISVGKNTLKFVFAPMVHWPEVMMTYLVEEKVLFSADAFGSFGALDGNLFAEEKSFEEYLPEARRYYTNIVGKYGAQVQAAIKKLAGVPVDYVCPLHGVIWKKDFAKILAKYLLWADYEPETSTAMIVYGSVYGDTAEAAETLAAFLAERGVRDIKVYDVSKTHYSYLISEAFRVSNIVFASITYNASVFPAMEHFVRELTAHGLKKRSLSIIQNGSWAPVSGAKIKEVLAGWKDSFIVGETVTLNSAVKENTVAELATLADAIVLSMNKPSVETTGTDVSAMFKISYGLYVLTVKDGDKDNGCIINTASQITENPRRVTIAVNKSGYTCELLQKNDLFNLSVLSEKTPFDVFKRFGFASGRDTDKFAGTEKVRSSNGLTYLPEYANAVISAKIVARYDYGTHMLFVADVTEAKTLSGDPSATYDYYFKHIKTAPPKAEAKKKGFVCKICNYVYEGETLPPDFICPICKHGAEDFEPLK